MGEVRKETPEETAARAKAVFERATGYIEKPWTVQQEPYQVTDNVYFLGNSWVSAYLINTSAGLVMIDTTYKEAAYQLFDAIRFFGFDPHDIKYLFLSHGHWDHVGAVRLFQEYSRCKTYIGEGDAMFFKDRRDLIRREHLVPEFTLDGYYNYNEPMTIGDTTFMFYHTPGHTPGCTTFMFNSTHKDQSITCAMHGGLGTNGISFMELDAARLPRSLQDGYFQSLMMLKKLHVDVTLPSHMNMYNMNERKKMDDGSMDAFINPDAWNEMIDKKLDEFYKIQGH